MKINNTPSRNVATTQNCKTGRTTLVLKSWEPRKTEKYGTYIDFIFEVTGYKDLEIIAGAPLGKNDEIKPNTRLYNYISIMTGVKALSEDMDVEGALNALIGAYFEADLEISKDSNTNQPRQVGDNVGVYYLDVGVLYKRVPGGVELELPQGEQKPPSQTNLKGQPLDQVPTAPGNGPSMDKLTQTVITILEKNGDTHWKDIEKALIESGIDDSKMKAFKAHLNWEVPQIMVDPLTGMLELSK